MNFDTAPQINKKEISNTKKGDEVTAPEQQQISETKDFESQLERISNLILEIKKNIPSAKFLTDIYERSLSSDHYHETRATEVSILMMLRVHIEKISNEMTKYKNVDDDSFGKTLQIPYVKNIDNVIDILHMDTGNSTGRKFLDADTHKIYKLLVDLKNTIQETKQSIDQTP